MCFDNLVNFVAKQLEIQRLAENCGNIEVLCCCKVVFCRSTSTTANGDCAVAHAHATKIKDNFKSITFRHNDVGDNHIVCILLTSSMMSIVDIKPPFSRFL